MSLKVIKEIPENFKEYFNDELINFIVALEEKFGEKRKELLANRDQRQAEFDAGKLPDFEQATKDIRESDWVAAPTPDSALDRKVEITGPPDRKMVINALNSGAKVFMADFEDSHSPVWEKTLAGQINLKDAIRNEISFDDPKSGKHYALNDEVAVLMVRPRGLHLEEPALEYNNQAISASFFDFATYLYLNHQELFKQDKTPYFYLPKTEHYTEAQLWNDVIKFSEDYLKLNTGTIKVTLLIETFPAVFCMHEIIHALKDNVIGLNCGRWDYIFSYIKVLHNHHDYVLPDRKQVHMGVPFLDAYSKLLIQTCHKRKIHAMGGMSAFIPVKGDEAANQNAMDNVKVDKEREVNNGHDGTWVAHPGLVQVALDVFDKKIGKDKANQKEYVYDAEITQVQLIACPEGTITNEGFNMNIQVSLRYLTAWLGGSGAVPIFGLMEDVATAEISRSQIWQWIKDKSTTAEGATITQELFTESLDKNYQEVKQLISTDDKHTLNNLATAKDLLHKLVVSDNFTAFLTIGGMKHLN